MKYRIILLFSVLIFLWAVLILRAAYLQVWPNSRLESLKRKQFETILTLNSRRGVILDRNNKELAVSALSYSLYADPFLIEDKKAVAKALSADLSIPSDGILAKLDGSAKNSGKLQKPISKRFVWIKRGLERSLAEKIKSLDIKGLAFIEEWKRIYPNDSLAAQILGFTGSEGHGLEGLEMKMNLDLAGKQKKIEVRRDARGRPLAADGVMFAETLDGSELQLTIDSEIQFTLEDELRKAIQEFNAESAMGVILEAQTSEVVAMASIPSFDINSPLSASPFQRRNRVLTDPFEQGSTLKTFVVAVGLREKMLTPNKKYNTEKGKMKIGTHIVREAESDHVWDFLTVADILAHSSNIGVTKIAFEVGADSLRKGLEDFGFGSPTGVDLPGESAGILQSLPWAPHLLSNVSFGHGIAATALQTVNAYAAIANGGYLRQPFVVKKKIDTETGKTEIQEPKTLRRILSTDDANKMKMMLTSVTTSGTGQNAQVPGFLVAGKTGTAQKVNPKGRGYLDGAYVSSFVGFIPANEPKYVIYVAVDQPRNSYYGSQVAAPIFSRVASFAARKAGLMPSILSDPNPKLAPVNKNKKLLEGGQPSDQYDFQGLVQTSPKKLNTAPDLIGLPLRDVLRRLQGTDLRITIRGKGNVAKTVPEPGKEFESDKKDFQVILEPN